MRFPVSWTNQTKVHLNAFPKSSGGQSASLPKEKAKEKKSKEKKKRFGSHLNAKSFSYDMDHIARLWREVWRLNELSTLRTLKFLTETN